jgi:hypothetical protein
VADDLTRRLARLACEGMQGISEDFADALDRPPTAAEWCELLAYGIQSSREDILEDAEPKDVVALRPKLRGADGDSEETALDELDDGVWSDANGLVTDLAHAYRGESGANPSLKALGDVLVEAFHTCGDEILSGARGEDVVALEPEVRRQTAHAPKPGDVVAIPAPDGDGRHFTAVVVARNEFGTAYGVFKGTRGAEPVSSSSPPDVVRHPIYSGDEPVKNGTWPIVGHDEGLLELFPREPEIFVGEALMPDVEQAVGPHGSAETPSGERRDISEEEAEEVGLTDGSYSEFHPPEALPEYLANREAQRS